MTKPVVLIPALNEEPRIGTVLGVVLSHVPPEHVVVIDDGSTDNTAAEAARYEVTVLRHEENKGKGAALQTGINHVGPAPLWIFLDADLINLQVEHLEALAEPFSHNPRLAMTVGMFTMGRKNVDLAQRYFGILNGQRALSGDYIAALPDLSWCRFGVEIFLSKYAAAKKLPVAYPILRGLTHHTKEAKLGLIPGFRYRLQMYGECLSALFRWQNHVDRLPAPLDKEKIILYHTSESKEKTKT